MGIFLYQMDLGEELKSCRYLRLKLSHGDCASSVLLQNTSRVYWAVARFKCFLNSGRHEQG